MKKLIIILFLFVGAMTNAQTFDFSCEPDCNRQVSIQEGLVYNNPGNDLHGNDIIGVTIQNGDTIEAIFDGWFVPDGAAITGLRVEDGSTIGVAVSINLGDTIIYSCENGFVLNDELSFAEVPADTDPLTDCDLPDITVHIVEGAMFAFPPSQLYLTGLSYNNVPIKGIYYAPTPGTRGRAHNGETFPRDAQIVGYIVEVNGEEVTLNEQPAIPLNIGITCSAVIVDGSNDNVSGDLHPINAPSNDIDISNLQLPARYSQLGSITLPGAPDGQYHYEWQPYLAYHSNGNNNGWSVRRNSLGLITGIKLGYVGQEFVEITRGTDINIMEAALNAAAHRYGDDDGEIISSVNYSNNYELSIIDVSEFDTGRGERIYATETDIFTKANGGHSNRSVVDLTPLSVIDGFNTRNDFTTTSRSSLLVTRGQAIAGEWYAIKTSDRAEVVKIVSVTQDSSGKDFAIFDGSDLTASIPSGTAVNVWQISDPTGFGIIRVNSRAPAAISSGWNGYYDLRGFNWSGSTHFDGRNGSGSFPGSAPFYDHVEADANSGSIAGRAYQYDLDRGGVVDQSYGVDAFGREPGNIVIMRSSVYPRGWGLYISEGSTGGLYYSLWYSRDLRHQWQSGLDNDFEAKRHGFKLSGARFIN